MYSIESGDKAGGFLIHIKECDVGASCAFLFVPNPMEPMLITREEIRDGLRYGTLKYFKKIPKDVYEVCREDYKFRAKKAGILCQSTI